MRHKKVFAICSGGDFTIVKKLPPIVSPNVFAQQKLQEQGIQNWRK